MRHFSSGLRPVTLRATVLVLLLLVCVCARAQCAQGLPGASPLATITFTAPALNTDGTPISLPLTYNLYQSTSPGAEVKKTTVTNSPIPVTIGLVPGTTYYWKLSVVDGKGNESVLSNEVCKSFPASGPAAVTISIS